jgi:sugar phosphate isomerase/epimerase
MKKFDLLASYWTLASGATPHTAQEWSPFSFEHRVREAARAGFTGFGIWHADLEHTLEGSTLAEMKRILDDHGMKHIEIEFLGDWWLPPGEKRSASDRLKRLLFEAANVFDAHHIKVGDLTGSKVELPQLIDGYANLCRDAERQDVTVLFELMPFARINNLPDALELVSSAKSAKAGIAFDLWHLAKLGIPHAAVAAFPKQFVGSIELNDGTYTAPWSMVEDTINHRRLCGEGEFDVRGFVEAMLAAGYDGPWGIEVLNADLRQLAPDVIADRAYSTTIAHFPT